ncbi:rhomboid family intramembrane serine protease [Roseibacillus persicicus]|uniref:Rhomboid family intramembrane serine protease n=1 Tax=Roseibacillus persicicus TaxID=454148 RepID=A0A918WFA9_9BACT|nr:rhomboid family intramembrane serine protease [Roseibacillus persicicus]MDQ8192370.1 rhomboid family intramembrane serine protease [Roseibacillus persicicus]GHC45868.1 rhomboid family intramembrane serine protease [Roseibacillus persicicus]
MNFGYGGGSYGYGSRGENWQPPLFRIGKLPINVTGLVILLEVIGMLAVVIAPENTQSLAVFAPGEFLSGSFWQVVSYPFFEAPSVWLLLGLFFFYSFGGMVENALGRGRYVRLLLAVSLTPAVVVTIASLLGLPGILVGSHLPHLAVFVAAIAMMPNAPMAFFGFPIKWLAVAFVGISLLQFAMMRNWGAFLALIAVAYIAMWWMRQAGHVSQWGVVEDVMGPRSKRKRPSRKKASKKKKPVYEKKLKPRAKVASSNRKDIDRILDKINEHGLHSLTEEERQTLQKESKRS